jgi:NAD(P)H-dependent FMN reductase
MIKIKILTGSNRPGRFNIQPATWITNIAKERKDIEVELLDLQEINLPFLDEPATPMMNQYTKQHTKDWSAKIAEGDGFIFITPEYNHSYSAVLKNAIDYLLYEWNYKPVGFVSYGSAAGGSRATEHLRGVSAEVKLFDIKEQVMFHEYWNHLDEKYAYKFTEKDVMHANAMLDALVFWATEMKPSREKLQSMQKK